MISVQLQLYRAKSDTRTGYLDLKRPRQLKMDLELKRFSLWGLFFLHLPNISVSILYKYL